MSESYRGTQSEVGDKVRPGEDTQARSGVDQQRSPNDPQPTSGVTQGHADPQQEKHGKRAESESPSSTGQPEKPHAHGDNPPSAVHGQANQKRQS
jgi:hypothetical protein